MTARILDHERSVSDAPPLPNGQPMTLNPYRSVSEIPIQWKGPTRPSERLLMLDIPVFYATRGGNTKRIAEFIADAIWQNGYVARAIDIRHVDNARLSRAQAVVLGASTQGSRQQSRIARFVRKRRDSLQRIPSAFFSVSPEAAARDPQKKQNAIDAVDTFLAQVKWRPEVRAAFGGPASTKSRVWPVGALRKIFRESPNTNHTTGGYANPTNWDTVTEFAQTLVRVAEERERKRMDAAR